MGKIYHTAGPWFGFRKNAVPSLELLASCLSPVSTMITSVIYVSTPILCNYAWKAWHWRSFSAADKLLCWFIAHRHLEMEKRSSKKG